MQNKKEKKEKMLMELLVSTLSARQVWSRYFRVSQRETKLTKRRRKKRQRLSKLR
jgi:hypothetical protein